MIYTSSKALFGLFSFDFICLFVCLFVVVVVNVVVVVVVVVVVAFLASDGILTLLKQIAVRIDELDVDVSRMEASFRELLLQGADALVSKQDTLNGGCLHLGATVILLIDASWEWLGKDGRVEKISSRFVAVHPKVSTYKHICIHI